LVLGMYVLSTIQGFAFRVILRVMGLDLISTGIELRVKGLRV